jgi:hypothetical protein
LVVESWRTTLFCETPCKSGMSLISSASQLQCDLQTSAAASQKYCPCQEKVKPGHTKSCTCQAKSS